MAAKTTSDSDFHFICVFYALDVVENAYNVDGSTWHILRYLGPKFTKFKNYANELYAFYTKKILWRFVAIGAPYHCANN